MRYLYHLATGGMTHMLWLLGSSIGVARATGRVVVPITQGHQAFRLPFHDIFESTDPCLADRSQTTAAVEEYISPATGLPDDPANLSVMLNEQGCYSIRNRPDLPPTYLGLDPTKAATGVDALTTTGQLLKNGAVVPPTRARVYEGLQYVISGARPRSATVAQAAQWRTRLPTDYIGVHYRNTDRQHSFDDAVAAARQLLRRSQSSDVYWATDDGASLVRARRALPDVTVRNYGSPIDVNAEGLQNLHYLSDDVLTQHGTNKESELRAVLADIYILTKATEFVRSDRSSLSWLVALLRSSPDLSREWFAGAQAPSA